MSTLAPAPVPLSTSAPLPASPLEPQDFGQSGVPIPAFAGHSSESGSSSGEGESGGNNLDRKAQDGGQNHSHAEAVASELDRHEAIRKKRKLDLPEALVAMGASLAAALASPDRSYQTNVKTQLAAIQQTQTRMVEALKESQKVNAALLAFLTQNTQKE
ncbi:hypothetical protein BBJ28_00019343 [Nothophytophthora sp. Chile5]|nr:hypothetical protein BBJ28_00019343 [Nothophytophthora sp. Chile5]